MAETDVQLGFDGSERLATEVKRAQDPRAGKPHLENPMLRLVGHYSGPELVDDAGTKKPATCGDCEHLFARSFSRTYFKCDQYSTSGSATTDFRLRWEACSLFIARTLTEDATDD